jgi:hypothetical protein
LGGRLFRGFPQCFQFALAPRSMALPRFAIEPFAHLHRFQPELQGLKLGKSLPPLGHGQFYRLVEVGNFRQPPVGKTLPDNAEGLDEKVSRP